MDEERLDRLWRAHADAVHAFATRRVGTTAASDVVTEVFIVALGRRPEEADPTRAWLLGVARNVIRHDRRAEGRRSRREAEVASGRTDVAATVDGDPVDLVAIARAVDALPPKERDAIVLVAWDQLSPAEAAEVAGCSPGAFRVRLHRARRRLADQLTEEVRS